MPKCEQGMSRILSANNYHFTGAKPDGLGATEYTLVSVICDVSSSVHAYRAQLVECVKSVVASCRRSPRADHLLFRLCTFNDCLTEGHGFKELRNIDTDGYDSLIQIGGCTALFEAAFEGIDATATYGSNLLGRHFCANGLVFVITDGMDNASKKTPAQIQKLLRDIWKEERLEGFVSVLIGVTGDGDVNGYLARFKDQAGLDHYLSLNDSSQDRLARLAGFMSRSIHVMSSSLASGSNANAIPLVL